MHYATRTQEHPAPAYRREYPRTKRPYLVFVRAGNDSRHQRLLRENPDRNWDCCVDWSVEPREESEADYYCRAPQTVSKLQGFLDFRKQFGAHWPYRYVLLLDDDIYLQPGDLKHFFRVCDYYRTYLSQPAQRWFTHTTLNSPVRNPACILRRVSFVEGTAPCFSAAALAELLHTFDSAKSTGWTWGSLLQDRQAIHVVDAVALQHTRIDNGPEGVEPQTFRTGHVYRTKVPKAAATAVLVLFERLKLIARLRTQFLRNWRLLRARATGLLLK